MKLNEFGGTVVTYWPFRNARTYRRGKMYVVPSTLLNRMYPQLRDAGAIHDCKLQTIFTAGERDLSLLRGELKMSVRTTWTVILLGLSTFWVAMYYVLAT